MNNSTVSEADRERWNAKYRRGEHAGREPSILMQEIAHFLPREGRAIDLAGGAGRHALWLAKRGLEVTLVDTSDVALELARQRAIELGVNLRTAQLDLQTESPPAGPWNVVICVHFLWRPLLERIPELLAPGGLFCFLQPTIRNLERHVRPAAEYLLFERELPSLVRGLSCLQYDEGWLSEGRHEARLVARREPAPEGKV